MIDKEDYIQKANEAIELVRSKKAQKSSQENTQKRYCDMFAIGAQIGRVEEFAFIKTLLDRFSNACFVAFKPKIEIPKELQNNTRFIITQESFFSFLEKIDLYLPLRESDGSPFLIEAIKLKKIITFTPYYKELATFAKNTKANFLYYAKEWGVPFEIELNGKKCRITRARDLVSCFWRGILSQEEIEAMWMLQETGVQKQLFSIALAIQNRKYLKGIAKYLKEELIEKSKQEKIELDKEIFKILEQKDTH